MAVVSRIPSRTESKAKPGSVNEEAKVGLTRRFLNRVRFGDDSSSSESSSDEDGTVSGSQSGKKKKTKKRKSSEDVEGEASSPKAETDKAKAAPAANWKQWNRLNALEQTMPSDAILPDKNAEEVRR